MNYQSAIVMAPKRKALPKSVVSKLALCALVTCLAFLATDIRADPPELLVKEADFVDPYTRYMYRVRSFNITSLPANSNHRSVIRVSRLKLNERRIAVGEPESIQTIKFYPTLVDFDLLCLPTYCYLVAVSSRSKKNIELYSWQRTQFDLLAKRDSFARPHGVKLFQINSGFYVAIAQEQLHLVPGRITQENEDSRFIGSVVLKFIKGHEQGIQYHQFIKHRFDPQYVSHFTSITNYANITAPNNSNHSRPVENHFLVFSVEPGWNNTGLQDSFIWSPLNDYFWPFRIPKGATIGPTQKNYPNQVLILPTPPQSGALKPQDSVEPVESCFHQLQYILNDREIRSRKLIESSRSLWRSPMAAQQPAIPTNITAQVIVNGDVIVRGSLIESPQITLFGNGQPTRIDVIQISHMVDNHSPAQVGDKLQRAQFKLQYIRDKLSKAVPLSIPPNSVIQFGSRIKFYGPIRASRVVFMNNGIANSNVRINGIPFAQLEHELVSLYGAQDIGAKVVFTGNVVADTLEIQGLVNGIYYIKDALDVTSPHMQVIDLSSGEGGQPNSTALDFFSVGAPEVILSYNATFNDIRLDDFITREGQTQVIRGMKSFRHLSMARLDLANPQVLLNGQNIGNIIANAISLRPSSRDLMRLFQGKSNTFTRPVKVAKLTINGLINRHINVSMLIHDSVKIMDSVPQHISGHKRFLHGLSIAHLTTEGAINGVLINQLFNLNPLPPVHDYNRYANTSDAWSSQNSLDGAFVFSSGVQIKRGLSANLINDIDITSHAVRRGQPLVEGSSSGPPQIIFGKKTFFKPLRITNTIRLLDNQQLAMIYNGRGYVYPLINGLDIRRIKFGIEHQREKPNTIFIDNLEIEGNLNLDMALNRSGRMVATFGNHTVCPLDAIRHRLVLGGGETQNISGPVRIGTLRAKSVRVEPAGLNGLTIPDDFVLKFTPNPGRILDTQHVFGHKSFEHLVVSRPDYIPLFGSPKYESERVSQVDMSANDVAIQVGSQFRINSIANNELQAFMAQERLRNSSGETILQTLSVRGNIIAKTINGNSWPDGILLKSVISLPGPTPSPYLHRRIYSPIVFSDSSRLVIENQLVLRGPIQLSGFLNGVNLTEFGRSSITYGDKDLLSVAKTVRNKFFAGGITVSDEIRAQGLIDGVNIDEFKNRVVLIGPNQNKVEIAGPKSFLSDVFFLGPLSMAYLNNLPMYQLLKRMLDQQPSDNIRVLGKKTITGELKINRHLTVEGLINGFNFVDLKARAISLAPLENPLQFNKTLTIDGNIFMDNLLIDERDGTIDGVKLINLIPIDSINKNELSISDVRINEQNFSQGHQLNLQGQIHDCQLSCSLAPLYRVNIAAPYYPPPPPPPQPLLLPASPPHPSPPGYYPPIYPNQARTMQSLANRRPISVQYERPEPVKYQIARPVVQTNDMIDKQLNSLRKQIVSMSLAKYSTYNDLIVGFIESMSNDISALQLAGVDYHDSIHDIRLKSFLQFDQIDFPFRPTIYHLSVGILRDYNTNKNVTTIFSSIGGSDVRQFSVLPVDTPRSAMFLKIHPQQALFLLISEDLSQASRRNAKPQCPRYQDLEHSGVHDASYMGDIEFQNNLDGVHVFLFHALQNSSSLASAYFDLYQQIQLPKIDKFEKFSYHGSTYVLAASTLSNRVHLLLLRGYTGFEIVSSFDVPSLENLRILFDQDERPFILIEQNDGLHKLMEPVII